MKKNYFGKLLAIAMVFAGFSLTSCDENDNAIINGKEWVKPGYQLVDGGAIITGSSTADISRMLGRVREEIMEAAQNGEKFTIDIQTPVLNSTAGDNTLIITAAQGGDVVLNLPSNVVTEVPLMIQAMGVADDTPPAATSTNEVEINIPSNASNIDLGINMPTSTVTLKGGTIENLAAKTALSTLVIESGVTVNWLKMLGGRALVKDGGKVLGYLRDGSEKTGYGNDAEVDTLGVWPIYNYGIGGGYDVYYIKEETEKPYYAQGLKIVKGEQLKVARVRVANGKQADEAKVIIADGAAASFSVNGVSDAAGTWYPAKVSIKGEGNRTAKIYSNSPYKNSDEDFYRGSIYLGDVNEISNVTVDATTHPDYYDTGTQEYEKVDILLGSISLPKSSTDCDIISAQQISGSVNNSALSKVTNCNLTCPIDTIKIDDDWWETSTIRTVNANNSKLTAVDIYSINGNSENNAFKSNYVSFNNFYISDNSATVKNCTFETVYNGSYSNISLPYQTEKRSSFDFIFDKCQLGSNFRITTSFESNQRIYDKDGNLVTKCYYYFELEADGVTLKTNDDGNYIWKQVFSESDIPEANKKNGENKYNDDGWLIGWESGTNPNGYTKPAKYKNYKCYITFNNSTLGGKAISKNTDLIYASSWAIDSENDDEGNVTTTTYINIDGKNFEPAWSPNAKKWVLSEVE